MTKTITTVETITAAGRTVGKILQDESGFFYRPGTTSGLHKPGKDGAHFPTLKAAKQAIPGAVKTPQEKAPKSVKPQAVKSPQETPQNPVSRVKYKLVETLTSVGTYFWIYAGYEHASGFRWESGGVTMLPTLDAVTDFVERNGITLEPTRETVDVRQGEPYCPNKAFIQQHLL